MTWYQVMPHGWQDNELRNTFQLVIAANDAYSFVIYNYGSLSWPNRQIDKVIQAGYYLGTMNKQMNFNLTMTSNLVSFSQGSNCNVKGKYIFRLNHSGKGTIFIIILMLFFVYYKII